ncbi:MAG: holo-ACP synthase [Pelagibacterales bacterium]|nr:holo-ACP synthase [Pelagibacterales bacterium]OUU61207.1 MAG: holo-ACP synthase [Alphaproteobacteria bacterium TMED62]|tara:strand:+ start:6427 stop:6819 length:393 start_codon:yes stop_codon:yes gene_type:complete
MILGIGMDLCKISRINATLNRYGDRFKKRCFTNNEIKKCNKVKNSSACYAKRFASKEAVSKAIGTGISQGVYWKDIEIINMKNGKPTVVLKGNAKKILMKMMSESKDYHISITITDEDDLAQAFVIIETN